SEADDTGAEGRLCHRSWGSRGGPRAGRALRPQALQPFGSAQGAGGTRIFGLSSRSESSVAQSARVAPAAVLPPERADDQQERSRPHQVEPTALFDEDARKRQLRLGEREQQEAARKRQEQAFACPLPKLQEEQRRNGEAHDDGAAKERFEHDQESSSQMNPKSRTITATSVSHNRYGRSSTSGNTIISRTTMKCTSARSAKQIEPQNSMRAFTRRKLRPSRTAQSALVAKHSR